MFRFASSVAILACAIGCVFAGYAPAPYASAPAPYASVPNSYAAPDIVNLPQQAEANAAAQTNNAGAQASAAKINAVNYAALNRYGHQIGVPLLAREYGPLTGLYAAALPPRSYVGKIDPAFIQGPYGKIQHVGESQIGVAVV